MNKNQKKEIIILHGWTYSVERWKEFISLLEKEGFSIDFLKIPGLTTSIGRPWTLEDYVGWLKQIIDAKKSNIILLGHSNGGRIAAKYASLFPEKIEHVILIDSAGIYDNSFKMQLKRNIFGSIAKVGKMISKSEAIRSVLYKAAREQDYKNATPVMRLTMKNLIRADLREDLPNIKAPTTIIWGKNDKATPLEGGKIMHSLIQGSTLHVLDARHSPMFTNVNEVVDIIKKEV